MANNARILLSPAGGAPPKSVPISACYFRVMTPKRKRRQDWQRSRWCGCRAVATATAVRFTVSIG